MLGLNLKQSSVFLRLHNPADAPELKKILTEHYSNQSIKKLCKSINTFKAGTAHFFCDFRNDACYVSLYQLCLKNFEQGMGQNRKPKLNFNS